MTTEVIRRVPRDELQTALEQLLPRHFGEPLRMKSWRRRLSNYSSSYPIECLQVKIGRGKILRLVFKDLSPASLMTTAQKVRPHFIYHPEREIETYLNTFRDLKLGTAVCYGAVNSPQDGRHWLLLERIDGPLLWQVGGLKMWQDAARWLAMLHNDFNVANRPEHLGRLAHLVRQDERYFALWRTRAEQFIRHKRPPVTPQLRRRFARLMNRYDQVIQTLLRLPATLIHGEFYPSNIIVRGNRNGKGNGGRICPIDWELSAVAPGLIDLAALTSGAWSEEDRESMIAAYREVLEPDADCPSTLAGLTEAVDYCRLHLAVQWLGWSADWSPPDQHARNWLREALRLADKLGLC